MAAPTIDSVLSGQARNWLDGTVAELVAQYFVWRGVERVYGLCGGHIQPIWDAMARRGIAIVDVRHECAAVYMAHAEAELTGRPGIALVTAGPGLTNAVTGLANASVSRAPVVLLCGRPPRPQTGRGALQELPQDLVVAPLCRTTLTVDNPRRVLAQLDRVMMAAAGYDAPPGPAYLDFPTDVLDEMVRPTDVQSWVLTSIGPPDVMPSPLDVARARQLVASARRPLVIGGRGVREVSGRLTTLIQGSGMPYVDSGESRGALAIDHPNVVSAVRGLAIREADLVITLDRNLNFQFAYGSPAVFHPDAKFLRIASYASQLSDNRRGTVELRCSVAGFVDSIGDHLNVPDLDTEWVDSLRVANGNAVQRLAEISETASLGSDGFMHPYQLMLAINNFVDEETVIVADGGDTLSFARVALNPPPRLDSGALGCLGVGLPFANAAAMSLPGRLVLAVIGDGSFGFSAMEVDTAVRHRLNVVYVVANNQAWNIEKTDQLQRYDGRTVGVDLPGCRYDLLAEALGASGRRVTSPADLPAALAWAQQNTPAVLDVLVTQDVPSPDSRAGLATVPTLQAITKWQQSEERAGRLEP